MSKVSEAIVRLKLDIQQAYERLEMLEKLESQMAEYEAKQHITGELSCNNMLKH